MGKGIDKFMNILSLSSGDDDDYDNDDLFDDEIDLVEPPKQKQPRQKKEPKQTPAKTTSQQRAQAPQTKSASGYAAGKAQSATTSNSSYDEYEGGSDYGKKNYKSRPRTTATSNKVVSMNSRGNEVYVIKPQDFNEAQTITDFLRDGRAIIINMEGIELSLAQRIIDFVGGACYALDGALQAISGNIFVASPSGIEVSGDLREELLNDSTVSPNLGAF